MSGFTLPTDRRITQAYLAEFDDWDGDGVVDYPGGFYHSIGWNGHNGIDYGCNVGDAIEAVADGYVAFAAWAGSHWLLSGGGNAILVEHREYGVQTEYLHLSRFAVSAGQRVTKGQVIGYAGATGAATAAHLHLGMLPLTGINVNNRMRGRIDPTPYLYGPLNPDYASGLAVMGDITPTTEPLEDELSQAEVDKIYEFTMTRIGQSEENIVRRILKELQPIASAVVVPEGHITPATAAVWSDYNRDKVVADVSKYTSELVAAAVSKLLAGGKITPAATDLAAISKAVNDEAADRRKDWK